MSGSRRTASGESDARRSRKSARPADSSSTRAASPIDPAPTRRGAAAAKSASRSASSASLRAAEKQQARPKKGGASESASRTRAQVAAPDEPQPGRRPRRGVFATLPARLGCFSAVLLVMAAVLIGACAFSERSDAPAPSRSDGLPGYITDEMIDTARAMRHEYGHPVGCTLAQIIQESGQGASLSLLAQRDNNLFGMKWVDAFADKPGVVGPDDWQTGEEYDGAFVTVTGTFIAFESKKACIEFRSSVFLQASSYTDNPTIKRAIETNNSALMAWGLQDAGWATDSSYAEHLIALMDQYDLYRFDA